MGDDRKHDGRDDLVAWQVSPDRARVELRLAAPALAVEGPLQVERAEVVARDGALVLIVTARISKPRAVKG